MTPRMKFGEAYDLVREFRYAVEAVEDLRDVARSRGGKTTEQPEYLKLAARREAAQGALLDALLAGVEAEALAAEVTEVNAK